MFASLRLSTILITIGSYLPFTRYKQKYTVIEILVFEINVSDGSVSILYSYTILARYGIKHKFVCNRSGVLQVNKMCSC